MHRRLQYPSTSLTNQLVSLRLRIRKGPFHIWDRSSSDWPFLSAFPSSDSINPSSTFRHLRFSHKDGDSMSILNVGVYLQVYTALDPEGHHRRHHSKDLKCHSTRVHCTNHNFAHSPAHVSGYHSAAAHDLGPCFPTCGPQIPRVPWRYSKRSANLHSSTMSPFLQPDLGFLCYPHRNKLFVKRDVSCRNSRLLECSY